MGIGYCGFGDEVWTEGFFGLILRLDWMYEGLNLKLCRKKGYLWIFVKCYLTQVQDAK